MRYSFFLATLLAGLPSIATSQSEAPLTLGVPGEIVQVQPLAFTGVHQLFGNLILMAHPQFLPVVQDFVAAAPPEGISVSICGLSLDPIQPDAAMSAGEIVIPFGDGDVAGAAAFVIAGYGDCATFLAEQAAAQATADPDTMSIMPPLSAPNAGLTIASPSDRYDVPPNDIITARIAYNPNSGRHDHYFTFGPATTRWIATNTSAHVGEVLELLVCGNVVNAPVVQEPILAGALILTGPVSIAEAEAEMAQIMGNAPCP